MNGLVNLGGHFVNVSLSRFLVTRVFEGKAFMRRPVCVAALADCLRL